MWHGTWNLFYFFLCWRFHFVCFLVVIKMSPSTIFSDDERSFFFKLRMVIIVITNVRKVSPNMDLSCLSLHFYAALISFLSYFLICYLFGTNSFMPSWTSIKICKRHIFSRFAPKKEKKKLKFIEHEDESYVDK